MPPSLSIGAFVLGSVLLLLSVVRGGFKLFGAEVSGSAGGGARVVAFVAGVVLLIAGFVHDGRDPEQRVDRGSSLASVTPGGQPRVDTAAPGHLGRPPAVVPNPVRDTEPTVHQAATEREAAVEIAWQAATQELIPIVQSLSPAEQMAIGMQALATGQDIYAIRVRITNSGGLPIDVLPDRVRLFFNGAAVPLYRTADSRFLQPRRLEPNQSAEGLLTFTAPVMLAGAVMAGGRLTYQDANVRVTYPR